MVLLPKEVNDVLGNIVTLVNNTDIMKPALDTLPLEFVAVTTNVHAEPDNPENVVGFVPLVENPEEEPLIV